MNMIHNRNLLGTALEEYKKTLTLNGTQKDIIVGTLLGDSTMGLRVGKPLYSIKFEQSVKRENYIYHLSEEFKEFCGSPPSRRWIDKGKTRESIWFRTYRHDAFIFYFHLFYVIEEDPITGKVSSRKIVPVNIANFLNQRVLAYWFMDDGTCHRDKKTGFKQYYLSIHGFRKEECELLCDALNSKLHIKANVHKDKKYWRIFIRQESVQLFRQCVSPYIHNDLKYKL